MTQFRLKASALAILFSLPAVTAQETSAQETSARELGADAQPGFATGDLVSNPGQILTAFDPADIGPILTEIDVLWQTRQDIEGRPYIEANADGRIVFIIEPLACRGTVNSDCIGMQLVAVFDGQADPQQVRDFNNNYAFANLGINENGNAYLNRYDIADYGIPRGNVGVIIDTFIALGEIYQDLSGQGSLGDADDQLAALSAKSLSERERDTLVSQAAAVSATPRTRRPVPERVEEAVSSRRDRFKARILPRN